MKITFRPAVFVLSTLFLLLVVGCSPFSPFQQTDALLNVFDQLYDADAALNSDISYIAVDVPDDKLFATSARAQIQNWVLEKGLNVLWTDLEGLEESGLVDEDRALADGILFQIQNVTHVTESNIRFDAMKLRSPKGATGGSFSLYSTDGETWDFSGSINWIS